MIYLLLRENALTKRIASGVLSRASIIRAGKAGMIPSNRRQLTGFMKGNKNMAKKLGIKFEKSPEGTDYYSYTRRNNQKVIGVGNTGFDSRPVTPAEHSLSIRHEIDEAKVRKKQSRQRKKYNVGPGGSHAGVEVVRREKQNVDRFARLNPKKNTKRAVRNFNMVRADSGEYDQIKNLKTNSQSKRTDILTLRKEKLDQIKIQERYKQYYVNARKQPNLSKQAISMLDNEIEQHNRYIEDLKKQLKGLKRPTHHGS